MIIKDEEAYSVEDMNEEVNRLEADGCSILGVVIKRIISIYGYSIIYKMLGPKAPTYEQAHVGLDLLPMVSYICVNGGLNDSTGCR